MDSVPGKTPLFMQLKKKLEAEIEGKEPNSRLDSEHKLAEKYSLSRGTVRKVIENLISEGKLYRIPRKGTFVSPGRIKRHFDRLPSYSEEIRESGFELGVHLVELGRVIPEENVRQELNLKKEEPVWKVKRVRTADDEPVLLTTSFLPVDVVPELSREEVTGSLYKSMDEKYSGRPAWARESYSCINADQVTASLLNVKPGFAVFFSRRLSFSAKGRPVEYSLSYIRGDKYELYIDINRLGTGTRNHLQGSYK